MNANDAVCRFYDRVRRSFVKELITYLYGFNAFVYIRFELHAREIKGFTFGQLAYVGRVALSV